MYAQEYPPNGSVMLVYVTYSWIVWEGWFPLAYFRVGTILSCGEIESHTQRVPYPFLECPLFVPSASSPATIGRNHRVKPEGKDPGCP